MFYAQQFPIVRIKFLTWLNVYITRWLELKHLITVWCVWLLVVVKLILVMSKLNIKSCTGGPLLLMFRYDNLFSVTQPVLFAKRNVFIFATERYFSRLQESPLGSHWLTMKLHCSDLLPFCHVACKSKKVLQWLSHFYLILLWDIILHGMK